MTQDAVGQALGISRQRVQQIERIALAKMARGLGFEVPGRIVVGSLERVKTCGYCSKQGHNKRSCGRKPVRR